MSDEVTPEISRSSDGSKWRSMWWGQLFAMVILFAGICLWLHFPSSMSWLDVAFFALLVWQCEMLGFWLGLGTSRFRWLVVPLAAFALGWMASHAAEGEFVEFQVFCWSILFFVGFTTGMLRRFVGNLQRIDAGAATREGLQFGIQHVMLWTTVLAILFGVCRYLAELELFRLAGGGEFGYIAAIGCCISFATVATVWAVLGKGILLSRIVGMALVIVVGSTLTQLVGTQWQFTFASSIAQTLVLVFLVLLRFDRYRFLKRLPE